RKCKHALAACADEQGRMRLLNGLGIAVEPVDLVVGARECERLETKEPLYDVHRLFQTVYACTGSIKRHTCLLILSLSPACSQTQLKPAIRENIQRGGLLC